MEDNSKNRVVRWTQKLLDLSLRNRLLNARDSKQILPLAVDDVASLEDRLSADQAVAVEPSDSQSRSAGALRSTLASDDMLRRLKEIFRLAKTDLEESGVNALYLALGFLRWRPKGANAKECRAPILLMPVQMTRKNVREGYTVSRLDDDTMLNATLVEFLRAEFGIAVEGVDPLPEDDSGVDVDAVMASFEAVELLEAAARLVGGKRRLERVGGRLRRVGGNDGDGAPGGEPVLERRDRVYGKRKKLLRVPGVKQPVAER